LVFFGLGGSIFGFGTMSLVNVACNEVKIAVNKLNSRPRKCLGFKTPYQEFFERTGIDARQLGVVRL